MFIARRSHLTFAVLTHLVLGLPNPEKYWCSDPDVEWAKCAVDGGTRMMEELPGVVTAMPAWWETMPEYERQCPSCKPIWLLCPSEDTGGWDGGDMLRLGGMMMLELINKQQWLLPGYELMCEYYNDACSGTTGQKIVTSRTMENSTKYVAIAQSGCSGVSGTVATYTPTYNMPIMSWAAGMPDLTNRMNYPNFFRTRIPHTAFTYAWLKVAELCSWKKFVVILAEEARFRGHFELMKREITAAGREVALEAQILQPRAQADDLMMTVKRLRLRIMQMITYETTWRALMCSSRQLGMKGLVWMVYGFYNKGYYSILDKDLSQWNCGKNELREISDTAIFATSTMWAPKPDLPIFCDKDGVLTTNAFKQEYLEKAALLSDDGVIARGGRDYRINAPRDAGAQAADGACLYAQVLSAMLGLHPLGRVPSSGQTYSLSDLQARKAESYEDISQLLQASSFNGVSGSPFTFSCNNMPSNGVCDSACRNSLDCTGDPNGATIVFQFDKNGKEGDSDGLSPTSEFPRILVYERGIELAATTDSERDLAYDWNKALAFPWGGFWGGAKDDAPWVPTAYGPNGEPCVPGYHLVDGTAYCVPDDMLPQCPEGQVLQGEFCGPCEEHTRFDTTLKLCLKCEPGKMQALEGQTFCEVCPRGKVSNALVPYCTNCSAGTYTEFVGLSECKKCAAGESSNEAGMSGCERCAIGFFANATQTAHCTVCLTGETTLYPGSVDASSCVCSIGFFISGNECVACPVGSTTESVGSSNITDCLCEINKYMQGEECVDCPSSSTTRMPDGTLGIGAVGIEHCKCKANLYMSSSDQCEACPEGLICAEGSECKSNQCALDSSIKNPVLAANYWSDSCNPLFVFKCGSEKRCPADRQPGVCSGGLQKQACAHCADEWVYNGEECIECSSVETSSFLFPIFPLLLAPIIVVMLYKIGGDKYEKWNKSRTGLMNVAFILFNHYQIITLIRGVNFTFPVNVGNVFDTFVFTSDVSTIFKPECAGFANFQNSLIIKSVAPAMVACAFILTWMASQIICKYNYTALMMEKNRTLNAFFSIMFTFFAGITSMAFTLFKCADNPSGKRTLMADRSVICDEGDWNGMVVIGVLAVLVWCFGMGTLFCRAVIVAPSHFHDSHFRMRWKFLFLKFRPDVHWWSVIFVMKGILLNLGFVFISTGIGQVYWIMAGLSAYLMTAAFFRPWRHVPLSYVDIYVHLSLILTMSALTWFIRNDVAAEDLSMLDEDMRNLAIALTFLCWPVCAPFVLFMIVWRDVPKFRVSRDSEVRALKAAMLRMAQMDDNDFLDSVAALPEADFRFLLEAKHVLHTEVLLTKSRSGLSSHQLSGTLPEIQVPLKAAPQSIVAKQVSDAAQTIAPEHVSADSQPLPRKVRELPPDAFSDVAGETTPRPRDPIGRSFFPAWITR